LRCAIRQSRATEYRLLKAIQAVLPSRHSRIVGVSMFDEIEAALGFQRTPHLGQRTGDIGNRAQCECADNRIERCVRDWKLFCGQADELDRK
jgi:hypothetical protein